MFSVKVNGQAQRPERLTSLHPPSTWGTPRHAATRDSVTQLPALHVRLALTE